jgi:hypothetical protein
MICVQLCSTKVHDYEGTRVHVHVQTYFQSTKMFVQLRLVQYVYSCTKVHAMYEGKTTYSIFVLSIISVALQLRRPECGFSPALSF